MLLILFLRVEIGLAFLFSEIMLHAGEKKSKDNIAFSRSTLKTCLKYLIQSCYFMVGNSLLRQKISIPVGIDPAPFWVNLISYTYENEHLLNLFQMIQ